jgi:hypothetical protein
MNERDGVLIFDLKNGSVLQVKLAADRVEVLLRYVPVSVGDDTESDTPPWTTAYGHTLSEWMLSNSEVWQWLIAKGIDQIAATRRLLELRA